MKFDFVYGVNKYPLFNQYWSLRGNIDRRDIFANSVNHILSEYDHGHMSTWVARSEIEHDAPEEGQRLLDPRFFETYLKSSAEFRTSCKAFHRKMWRADHSQRSDQELLALFRELGENLMLAYCYFKGSRPEYTKPVEKELQIELEKVEKDQTKLGEWSAILMTPDELDDIKHETIAWDSLALRSRTNKDFDLEQTLLGHILSFSWLFPDQLDAAIPLKNLRERFESESRSDQEIESQIQKIKDDQEVFRQKRQLLLDQINNERIRYLANVIARSALERLKLKDCWAGIHTVCGTLWRELSQRTKLNVDTVFYHHLYSDIESFIQKNRVLSKEDLAARQDYTLMYLQVPELVIKHGAVARQEAKKILAETLEELKTDTLKGQVASLGHVQGKVRIVPVGSFETLSEAMTTFQSGEILVTQMTQPNMVPLAKRAAAIITDEGGIASHAAIISREFKIPCIVGTKLATRVLRNGDEVEVDAQKGIVKRLRSSL